MIHYVQEVITMPTKNPRVMVVLEPKLHKWLKKSAKNEGVSVSGMIRDIVRDTYMASEDVHWVREGESRLETFNPQKAVSHEDAWKE